MKVRVESWEDSGADPKVIAWFAQYESLLMGFASRNNLAIAKYLKDSPSWHFVFAHPRGGEGRIDVTRVSEERLSVSATWYQDDYDEGTRSLKLWSASGTILPEGLLEELSATLGKVLAWSDNDFEVAGGYREMWHRYLSRKQVEVSKYPLPSAVDERTS
jgi:hypothetical protein